MILNDILAVNIESITFNYDGVHFTTKESYDMFYSTCRYFHGNKLTRATVTIVPYELGGNRRSNTMIQYFVRKYVHKPCPTYRNDTGTIYQDKLTW